MMMEEKFHEMLEILSDPLAEWIEKKGIDKALNLAADFAAYLMVLGLVNHMNRSSGPVDTEKRFSNLKKFLTDNPSRTEGESSCK